MRRRNLLYALFMVLILLSSSNSILGYQVLNETVDVEISSFATYIIDVNDSAIVALAVQILLGNDFSLLLLNESSYNIWNFGEKVPYEIFKEDIKGGNFNTDLSDAGRYFLIIDNSDGWLYNISVSVIMYITYPPAPESNITSYIIGTIVIAVATMGIIFYFKVYQDKQKRQNIWLVCETCNLKYNVDTKFCIECGEYLMSNHEKINNKGKKK